MYVCTHPYRMYLISSPFSLQHHMAKCGLKLKGLSTCESPDVHDVQVRGAVHQQNLKIALSNTKALSTWSFMSSSRKRRIHCVLLSTRQFSSWSYLEVAKSDKPRKPSNCSTALSSTMIWFKTSRGAWNRAVRRCEETALKYLKTKKFWRM